MIDHVSIGVRDLETSVRFYEAVLGAIGLKKIEQREKTAGFGKLYAEFWLNLRPQGRQADTDSGMHVCLRARTMAEVDAFHAAAVAAGGSSDGEPGPRPAYGEGYYAAFVRDPDGNRIEAVTFLRGIPDGKSQPGG